MPARRFSMEVAGFVPAESQSQALTFALRLVMYYGAHPPTPDQLQRDFGMSRATAYRYRWRAAYTQVLEEKGTNAVPLRAGAARQMSEGQRA